MELDNKHNFSLKNKIALVTGGTGHFGERITIALAKAGAKVYVNSRDKKKVAYLVKKNIDNDLLVKPAVFNITNLDEIKEFYANFEEDSLDIIVNNAYSGDSGTIETSNPQNYRDSFEISIVATHNLFKLGLPLLKQARLLRGDASIINIASMYGVVSPDLRIYSTKSSSNPPFYGVAKAALIHWTKYAACEFGTEGIRVNSISPGAFPTKKVDNELVKKIIKKVPLGRIGTPEEVVGPVLFLASNNSSYITGANIPVDGGWTAW